MIRWKGVVDPLVRDDLIHFTDVTPTLVEICKLDQREQSDTPPHGQPLDGSSFAGLLAKRFEHAERPTERFWQWNRGRPMYSHNAAVRQGDWKLVRPPRDPQCSKVRIEIGKRAVQFANRCITIDRCICGPSRCP